MSKKYILNILLLIVTISVFGKSLPSIAGEKLSNIAEENPYYLDSFAIIDIQRILEESKAAKSAKNQVSKLKKKYTNEAKSGIDRLKKEEKALKKQQKALSPEAFAKKVQSFQQKYQDGKKEAFKKGKIVEAAYAKTLGLIKDNVVKIVAEIAEERKIDLILSKGQILYSRNGVEITDEIIERLNKKLKTVTINVQKK